VAGISRRKFLRRFSAAAALGSASIAFPGIIRAQDSSSIWGDMHTDVWGGSAPDINILEIHLLGGVAPFESFYFRPSAGRQTRGFDEQAESLNWNPACQGTPAGLEIPALEPDQNWYDSGGKEIALGPFAKPFHAEHIRSKMRVVVLRHNLMPHEVAQSYSMNGLSSTNPRWASMGAAIAHRYNAIDVANLRPPRTIPYSYGLISDSAAQANKLVANMSAVGSHGGAAKPLVLRINNQFDSFLSQLQRTGIKPTANALIDVYREQYRRRLRFNSGSESLVARSKEFFNYDASASTLLNSASLSDHLSQINPDINEEEICAQDSDYANFADYDNPVRTSIEAAVKLLTAPEESRARYVQVIDHGLYPFSSGLGYDVHQSGATGATAANLWNTFSILADLIKDPSDPASASDTGKLDLEKTMIVINTEFGRTPFPSYSDQIDESSNGRDHWPYGYCAALIGGPIQTSGVVGSISDDPGYGAMADIPFNVTDMRAAVLVAMGIDPFVDEIYPVGELTADAFPTSGSHEAAAEALRQTILGLG